MKFQYCSDLHLDFYGDKGESFVRRLCRNKVADHLIIAGDMGELVRNDKTIGLFHRRNIEILTDNFGTVIEALGNHNYWHLEPTAVHDYHSDLDISITNYHWLANRTIQIGDVSVAGTVLWFRDDPLNVLYSKRLNDFHYIKGFVPWVYEENQRAINFIKETSCDVMVTHHLPSQQCLTAGYVGNDINCFYVCDVMDRELAYSDVLPKVWVHGHSHTSLDVVVNGVRVLRNPAGYVEDNHSYNMKAFFEVVK